ncbi:MAG TPA: nucleotide sugar dehydrogenase, partial [Acidimicrobiales bacterium]|nr:nucleotide sugar dehydrogenase [Acidimicrobiales bacterium]
MPVFDQDVVVIGGCGHVGLPLGLAFADAGLKVTLFDVNAAVVETISAGTMPFREAGAPEVLERVLDKNLVATTDPAVISSAEHVIIVIGTPVDDHLSLNPSVVSRAVEMISDHLVAGQLIVLRSTVYPGTTRVVESVISRLGVQLDIAFCPERIAEGRAMTELHELPQLIAARSGKVFVRAEKLFGNLTSLMVRLSPEEAELAKLFTNTWRYIKFATANQLYIFANDFGLDYERIRTALALEYPRAADLPKAGFAAGPCLLKDTLQLATF